MINNKDLVGMLENIHLLRKIAVKRFTSSSPLHFGQVAIMRTIERNENCTQASLAQQLNVTPASVATSTKRLQKAGLITKTVDSDNLRCKRLALTDEGREAISRHIGLFEDYDRLVFKDFSEEDKVRFMEYLERILSEMTAIEGINKKFNGPMEFTLFLRETAGLTADMMPDSIPESENED